MKTRKEYLAKECTHREYYGQFITDRYKKILSDGFGKDMMDRLFECKNLSLIPLGTWDRVRSLIGITKMMQKVGDTYTMSTHVCIAKEAIRQVLDDMEMDDSCCGKDLIDGTDGRCMACDSKGNL